MDRSTRTRLVALGGPLAGGALAALLTSSSDRVAFVEGPLPAFLFTIGVVVSVIALGVVLLVERRGARQVVPTVSDSGVVERLQMLGRLDDVITARLDAAGAHLDGVDHPEIEAARLEINRIERFMVDVQSVAALHDVELDLEEVDAAAVVASAVRSAARVAGDRVLKSDLPTPDVAPFRGDRKLLTLALINLVVNAVKYSTPHTPIVVRVTTHEGRVVFEVEDQGPGVPPDEDVWVELVRGSNAGEAPGTGLGLPLVRLIAERHGGAAALVSGPSGTTARITIPGA